MSIHYQKYSPTGNVTLLVTTPVPRKDQPGIAARLLGPGGVGGEQAGFIEPAGDARCPARLQMMGGEFCGNATMSLGAMLARRAGLAEGGEMAVELEVSGSAIPVPCRIRREGEGWVGTVEMPLPTDVGEATLATDAGRLTVPLVRLPGIAHLIIPAEAGLDEEQLRRSLPLWNGEIGADAIGALRFDAASMTMDPLVYVPSTGTLVREHGCGSGTAAVGCHLAVEAGRDIEASVRQPGGTITVRAALSGKAVTRLVITGRVTLMEEGDWDDGSDADAF